MLRPLVAIRAILNKPAVAQLVKHLAVEWCSNQTVPNWIRVAGFYELFMVEEVLASTAVT